MRRDGQFARFHSFSVKPIGSNWKLKKDKLRVSKAVPDIGPKPVMKFQLHKNNLYALLPPQRLMSLIFWWLLRGLNPKSTVTVTFKPPRPFSYMPPPRVLVFSIGNCCPSSLMWKSIRSTVRAVLMQMWFCWIFQRLWHWLWHWRMSESFSSECKNCRYPKRHTLCVT